jgi:hypothetical protein
MLHFKFRFSVDVDPSKVTTLNRLQDLHISYIIGKLFFCVFRNSAIILLPPLPPPPQETLQVIEKCRSTFCCKSLIRMWADNKTCNCCTYSLSKPAVSYVLGPVGKPDVFKLALLQKVHTQSWKQWLNIFFAVATFSESICVESYWLDTTACGLSNRPKLNNSSEFVDPSLEYFATHINKSYPV